MSANIEEIALVVDCASDAPHGIIGLDHHGSNPMFGKLSRSR